MIKHHYPKFEVGLLRDDMKGGIMTGGIGGILGGLLGGLGNTLTGLLGGLGGLLGGLL